MDFSEAIKQAQVLRKAPDDRTVFALRAAQRAFFTGKPRFLILSVSEESGV